MNTPNMQPQSARNERLVPAVSGPDAVAPLDQAAVDSPVMQEAAVREFIDCILKRDLRNVCAYSVAYNPPGDTRGAYTFEGQEGVVIVMGVPKGYSPNMPPDKDLMLDLWQPQIGVVPKQGANAVIPFSELVDAVREDAGVSSNISRQIVGPLAVILRESIADFETKADELIAQLPSRGNGLERLGKSIRAGLGGGGISWESSAQTDQAYYGKTNGLRVEAMHTLGESGTKGTEIWAATIACDPVIPGLSSFFSRELRSGEPVSHKNPADRLDAQELFESLASAAEAPRV